MGDDPFDNLLDLEDEYFDEGFALGTADGQHAGHIEGRLFGLEKGFEKYLEMGRLHGRSTVWGSRLFADQLKNSSGHILMEAVHNPAMAPAGAAELIRPTCSKTQTLSCQNGSLLLPNLERNSRIEKHLRTFHALVEPESLSTQNNEDDVSEFDDRLKRAYGKAKIIEKFMNEETIINSVNSDSSVSAGGHVSSITKGGDGSIEDVSSFQVR